MFWWNDANTGSWKYSEKNPSHSQLVHYKSDIELASRVHELSEPRKSVENGGVVLQGTVTPFVCSGGGGGGQIISLIIFILRPEFRTNEAGITGFLGLDIFSGNSISFRL